MTEARRRRSTGKAGPGRAHAPVTNVEPSAVAARIWAALGAAVIGLGPDRRFTAWDQAAEQLFGYTAAEALGQPLALIVPEHLLPQALANVERAIEGHPIPHCEALCRARDGELIPVALAMAALPAADGGPPGAGVLVRDLRPEASTRAVAEHRRRDQELLRAIIDNSMSAIYVKDTTGRYLLVNREWERLLGVERDRAIGQLDVDILPPSVAEQVRANDLEVIKSRKPLEFEEGGATPDGDERLYLSARIPLFAPDGEVDRICGFSTDITERRRSQEMMDSAREAAEAANRAKTDFFSRTSHELRTPLNVVLGFAQVLQLDPLRPDQEEAVDHILKAGRHLLTLIDDVLDLSRIEANRLPLSVEPVLAGDMLREVVGLLRPLADEHGIAIELDGGQTRHRVVADRQRIKQVMLNLLSNAIKYNRDGGSVRVRCRQRGDRIRIAVIDTGMGIQPELMERLFGAFDRLGAEATPIEGTGLGLALSHRLVQAMGGEIGVKSAPGEGSTFWIDLPMAGAPELPATRLPAVGRGGGRGQHGPRTILYIEDNLDNLQLVERLVRQHPGTQLLPAMQGSLGLELAREHAPDLVLLDLHLPDMNGERVLEALQADERTRDIPVVIASADATAGTMERLLSAGVRGYLTKPFNVPELLAILGGDIEAS